MTDAPRTEPPVGRMFYYDRGLRLAAGDLAIDVPRRQRCGFVSHAHGDHMARHELTLCTPATARLLKLRLGKRDVLEMPFGEPRPWLDWTLTAIPAGHCLGSAMLLVDDGTRRLLYTGDFRLGPSATAELCDPPAADALIMETTYGDPKYRLPSFEEGSQKLVAAVRRALERGLVPVVQAYALGKAQEATKILTSAGIAVLQEREVFNISRVYEACGVSLGDHQLYPDYWKHGTAIVTPPSKHRPTTLKKVKSPWTIACTGWALDAATAARWGVDEAVPLTDHADHDQLWTLVERVRPKQVYCFHGPAEFVNRLRASGVEAYSLYEPATWR